MTDIRVLGLGNILMGDDALGPWVIEELLARWEFPDGVTVADIGTPGLDLTPYLADADLVLLVDTVKADAPPGSIRIYNREQLLSRSPQTRVSPHDPGLAEALFSLEFGGSAPTDIVLIGVVPKAVAKGIGLTTELQRAVPAAAAEIIDRLMTLGFEPRPRRGPMTMPWWEKAIPVVGASAASI